MKLSEINKGDLIEISSVKHPELPHHAKWVGKRGEVIKTRKYDNSVFVRVPGLGDRFCYLQNIKIIEKKEVA